MNIFSDEKVDPTDPKIELSSPSHARNTERPEKNLQNVGQNLSTNNQSSCKELEGLSCRKQSQAGEIMLTDQKKTGETEELETERKMRQSSDKKEDSRYLTPLLMRYGSHLDKERTQRTYYQSGEKSAGVAVQKSVGSKSVQSMKEERVGVDLNFVRKYLRDHNISAEKVKNIFDVLRIEDKQFKMADSKLRMLLCLLKLLVVKSAFEKKRSFGFADLQNEGSLEFFLFIIF